MSLFGWALVLVAACTRGEGAETEAPRGMVAELARVLGPAPTLGPRLSIAREPSACASEAGCRETGTPSRRVNTVAARASQAARASVAPDALHASALVDLLWADDEGTSLRRSIQYLQTAARLDPRPAPILADLSAAHLVRAERANSPRDLLEAVETAERALQKDPANRAALFNRALGLERFGLMGEAGRSWRAYLAADSTSDWADAARKRLAEVSRVPVLPQAPSASATDAELAAYAVADPQGARTMGWDHLLGEWGTAVLAGDAAKAADRLHRAEVLGNALERAGRDATLVDAVRAIRAQAGSWSLTHRLAVAHRAFAEGREKYQALDYPAATALFASAGGQASLSSPLKLWADFFEGSTLVFTGRPGEGERVLREGIAHANPARHATVAGRLHLALGGTLLRTDRFADALREALLAAGRFSSAGEREHEGGALGIAADAAFALGDAEAGYGYASQAVERLRPYTSSISLHNLLFALAEHAAKDGYLRAAVHTQSEGLSVAKRVGHPVYQAEAILARARILIAGGELAAARRDLTSGRVLVERISEPGARAWFEADLRVASAGAATDDAPTIAAAALDSAIAFFDQAGALVRVFPALIARARANVAVDDLQSATRDLERAVAMLHRRRESVEDRIHRATLMEAARDVFDQASMLHLNAGRQAEALAIQELRRAPAATGGGLLDAAGFVAPVGEVALSYAIVADTLLIWALAGRDLSVSRTLVDTAHFRRTIDFVRSSLELGGDEQGLHNSLALLYDWLVRPVANRFTKTTSDLVVVADGVVATVPFSALLDRATGRYMVQDHALRFVTSLSYAWRSDPPSTTQGRALVISDPAFDPAAFPGLERLDGAQVEAASVARRYRGAVMLAETEATPDAFIENLRGASLIHYAGHAVFDDERPDRSFLVLAGRGPSGGARLTAAALSGLDLQGVGLVVLSACQTIRSGTGRTGGFVGLAGSLLVAGADGVIGSLWRADDAHSRAVMTAFYDEYRSPADASEALRSAQVKLLQSSEPSLRAPSAWAGFRYTGR